MRLVQAKSWCALVVLIGSVALSLTVAAGMQCSHRVANAGTDLRSILALRVALFTAPGHDPHRPPSVIASWATTLDRVLGACWLAAPADNRSSADAAPPEQIQCYGRFSRSPCRVELPDYIITQLVVYCAGELASAKRCNTH
jgi:hypothetical protein